MKKLILALTLFTAVLQARTVSKVTEPDEMTVDGHKLVLNGMAMRTKQKYGFDVDVYVGALYLEKKSNDSDAILKNDEIKVMVMHFVRQIDRDLMLDAFRSGYEDGCFIECDKKSDDLGQITPNVVSMRTNDEIKYTFYKDKVEMEVIGANAKKATLTGERISRNLLSMFINKKNPPTKKFRDGVLGL